MGLQEHPEGSSQRWLHESTPVEFYAAYVLVAHADMYVRRFETALPSIHNNAEPTFHYRWHAQFFYDWMFTACAYPADRNQPMTSNDIWCQCSYSACLGFTAIRGTPA